MIDIQIKVIIGHILVISSRFLVISNNFRVSSSHFLVIIRNFLPDTTRHNIAYREHQGERLDSFCSWLEHLLFIICTGYVII